MNKVIIFLLLLAIFTFTASAQKGSDNKDAPPVSEQQSQVASFTSEEEDWYCEVQFYYYGKAYYSERLDYNDPYAYKGSLSKKLDNKIDSIYWYGTRCYCWIVVYQSKYFKGLNLGLWADSTQGYYDLTKYITYDFHDDYWEPWYEVVSSYAIYCY